MSEQAAPRLWKWLGQYGTPCHGGDGYWHLPTTDQPGDWMPAINGELVLCKRGYHLCPEQGLVFWMAGAELYEAEYQGDAVAGSDKLAVRQARLLRRVDAWNSRTARLFAADCAEHVLPLFEQTRPGDDRPRQAIAATRDYAEGRITWRSLLAVADRAALAVVQADQAAAWAAAVSAQHAASLESAHPDFSGLAANAATSARVALACQAIDAGARDGLAVMASEMAWQTQRLLAYLYPEETRP